MSSNNTKSLDDFLYLDDSYSINEFFDDKTKVPYWFLIRNSVLRVLINKQLKSSITGVRKRTKYKILKMLFIYIVQVPLNILSVLMTFFSKRDVVLITRSESYSNPKRAIYTEYLIEKLSISPTRVISVETDESSAEAFRNEMIVFKSSSLKHILSIVCLLYSRVIKDKSVKEFMKALSSELSELKLDHQISEEEFIILEKELSVSLIRTRIMNLVYRIFICISRPKVIILEEGFYQHSVLLNKIASEKNIVTIEMQHGVVHPNHDAYNYSNDILQKKNLKQFFPDLFLTWGHFWEENIRIPTKTVSVGFPYRSSQLGNMRGRGGKRVARIRRWREHGEVYFSL